MPGQAAAPAKIRTLYNLKTTIINWKWFVTNTQLTSQRVRIRHAGGMATLTFDDAAKIEHLQEKIATVTSIVAENQKRTSSAQDWEFDTSSKGWFSSKRREFG